MAEFPKKSICHCIRYALGHVVTDQVLKGAQARLGAFAETDDDLLERNVRAVARRKEPRGGRGASGVDGNLAVGVEFDRVREPRRVGRETDLHEDARHVETVLGARRVRPAKPRKNAVGPLEGARMRFSEHRNVRKRRELLLEHVVRLKRRVTVQERDVRGDPREIDRGFNARVPAPDDGDALAAEERSVAVGTEGDAMAEEVRLSGNIETAPARAPWRR